MFSSFFSHTNGFILYILLAILFILLLGFLITVRKLWYKKKIPTLPGTPVQEQLTALNQELEPTGFAYDLNQDMFFSLMECWQREFGYCHLYDEATAPLGMILDCEPIPFNYGGKKWLIELWKGQYGMNTGAEIGVYNTEKDPLNVPGFFEGTLYHSADDAELIYMSYILKKNNQVLLTRNGLHWWLTGFKLGLYSEPSDLSMDIRITFPNRPMCIAFAEALYQTGYRSENILVRYHTVFFTYDKPHSPQPMSRTSFAEYLAQKNNLLYCETYSYVTRDQETTLDKLEYLRLYSPKMYRSIMNVGKDKELFRHFKILKSYESQGR